MAKLLIIEDSFLIRKVIQRVAKERLNCEYEFAVAVDLAQAKGMFTHNDYLS